MKKTKIFFLILSLIIIVGLFSCSSSSGGTSYKGYAPDASDAYYSKRYGDITDDDGYDSNIQSGQMTSKAWSDNENYQKWLDLITSGDNSEDNEHYLADEYKTFVQNSNLLKTKNMLEVQIKAGENVVENAKVIASIENGTSFTGYTNANGIIYTFFEEKEHFNLKFKIEYDGVAYEKELNEIPESRKVEFDLDEITLKSKIEVLDLCLIVDTTGSMSDELEYLKVELRNVLENIENDIDYDINLALIFYRDTGDEYVTRVFDFTKDLSSQYSNLGKQRADGGGDFPEAVDVALEKAAGLNWHDDSVKVLIHVLDAPLHSSTAHFTSFGNNVIALANKGVRMIPVICSSGGGDDLLEFTMRSAALMTGGTYTWLTDDSGIGGSHTEPSTDDGIPVEYFNQMLIRLIKECCTGEKLPPAQYNKQGEGGEQTPDDDKCKVTFLISDTQEYFIVYVDKGAQVVEPKEPTKEGYEFVGWSIWYEDGTFSSDFDFSSSITEDTRLIARWVKIS